MKYKECQKCHKSSEGCKYCKICLDSFPGKGRYVYNCINQDCKQEYRTNSSTPGYCPNCLEKIPGDGSFVHNCANPDCGKECRSVRRPGYCPDCKVSIGVGLFVRKCVNCPIMIHTNNRKYPLCPKCLEEFPGDGSNIVTCVKCRNKYRNKSGINGYCSPCLDSFPGDGNYVYNCLNCDQEYCTNSHRPYCCPNCLKNFPGKGSYVLVCDIHGRYKANATNSYCPVCFDEAKGKGDVLYNCINPECNKRCRSSRGSYPNYCPDCRDNIPGDGVNIVTCCVKGCKESFKTNAWGNILNRLMCEKHQLLKRVGEDLNNYLKCKREEESFPVAIKFLIDNFSVDIFDFDSAEQIIYSDKFADSLEGLCGVVIEYIDGVPVNLIKSVNLGCHFRHDIRPSRLNPSENSAKQALSDATKECRITYGILTASKDMSNIMALVYELLAALILKPICWNPEFAGTGEFQCRIYVDCEDPKDVFKDIISLNLEQFCEIQLCTT